MADDRHDCPGRCGRTVRHNTLACPPCWRRLPLMLRTAVSEGYARVRRNPADGTAHRLALTEALAWYQRDGKEAGRVG